MNKGFEELDGRKIQSIYYPGNGQERLTSNKNGELVFESRFHGTYETGWVVFRVRATGKEISRNNVQYLQTIVWE